jgi:ABC-type uncharacterized transport system fused permease/ATPase subunit
VISEHVRGLGTPRVVAKDDCSEERRARKQIVVVGAFYQVNQSLRWFVDTFAVFAEWRAALFQVIEFREVLSMAENAVPTGNKAVLDVIELDVARRRVRSRCFQ